MTTNDNNTNEGNEMNNELTTKRICKGVLKVIGTSLTITTIGTWHKLEDATSGDVLDYSDEFAKVRRTAKTVMADYLTK